MIILITSATLSVSASSTYNDVPQNHWAYNDIIWATNNQLMNGVGTSKFAPNDSMTRAMVVTVLYRMEGSPEANIVLPFSDVKQDWYTDAVKWAYKNEIVKGTSNTTFSPNGKVTREQIATILYRYCDYIGNDTSASANLSTFPDANKVGSWAETALKWANAEGLITGASQNGVTILNPQGDATRAQVATILHRYSYIGKEPYVVLGEYIMDFGEKSSNGSSYYIMDLEVSDSTAKRVTQIDWYPQEQKLQFTRLDTHSSGGLDIIILSYSNTSNKHEIMGQMSFSNGNKITGTGYIYSDSAMSISNYLCNASDDFLADSSKQYFESSLTLLMLEVSSILKGTNMGLTLSDFGFVNR